jgi:hypothetical protein
MRVRRAAVRRVAAVIVPLVAFGCSSLDKTNYGPPGGLTGKNLPLPSGQGDSGSGSSSGGTSGSSDAGFVDCGVSWANEIFPQMAATGHWKCSDPSACHGGLQSPMMTGDQSATYGNLRAYTMRFAPQKVPYVLPGDPDPSASGIECNLTGSSCGNRMPLATNGALLLDPTEAQMVDTWVKCGSPNN